MRSLIATSLMATLTASLLGGCLDFLPKKKQAPAPVAQAQGPVSTKPAGEQDLALAPWIDVGQFPCEEGGTVALTADALEKGYFVLAHKGKNYRMSPYASVTGALRLEDQAAGVVWLQLANKSMLTAPKKGSRLADGCMSEPQKQFAAEMKNAPSGSILGQ